ncbi:MAG: SulP family inorganic anion transporter [Chloroflexia bacterium]
MVLIRRREKKDRPPSLRSGVVGDLVAGLSVALVLIPQSLAYAELAGVPAHVGLYAAALPRLLRRSSCPPPYLQTGPTAIASLLTFGALSSVAPLFSPRYIALASLRALFVGLVRLVVGLARGGALVYLLSQTVLTGFISAAALIIIAGQIPTVFGVEAPDGGVFERFGWVLTHPASWNASSLLFAVATIAIVFGARRVHAFFPGVLLAVVLAAGYSAAFGYAGPRVGAVPTALPTISLDLPWNALPTLVLSGLVIALVGFAEPAAIARTFAAQDRSRWNPNAEFVSQGAANIVAGLVGGFPVGGSIARSALNRAMGARTRWSGATTGVAMLAFLPFAAVLAPLPKAVLGAVVITAVAPLVQPGPLRLLWSYSKPQFYIALGTFLLTLWFTPHVERAVMLGVLLAVVVHLWRELTLEVQEWSEEGTLHLKPVGVLWFGTAAALEEKLPSLLNRHPEARRLVIHFDGLGRVDLSGALAIRTFLLNARAAGIQVEIANVPPQTQRVVQSVFGDYI